MFYKMTKRFFEAMETLTGITYIIGVKTTHAGVDLSTTVPLDHIFLKKN